MCEQNQGILKVIEAYDFKSRLWIFVELMDDALTSYIQAFYKEYSENVVKYVLKKSLEGLDFLHQKHIIHRDIKPENLVIESDGYLRITDFGIARVWREDNAQDTSGTPGYMAPEVMCRQNHTCSVDYFAVGVIAYECMFGRRPYLGKSRKEIRDHILSKQV